MGLMQRNKGKAFERKVAAMFRERWPDALVVRASQGERAHNSDVFVEGGPEMLRRLWIECQDSRTPTPLAKLRQAERDIEASCDRTRVPVVIWHRTGSREIDVMTRIWVLDCIRGPHNREPRREAVAMTLTEFLAVLDETVGKQRAA